MGAKLLGEILIEREAISKLQLGAALFLQHQKGGLLGDILVQMGAIDESQNTEALMEQMKSFSAAFEEGLQQQR